MGLTEDLLCSFGVIMWEVVTHEIPVRGALRSIDVPKEAPAEVSAALRTRPRCQSIWPQTNLDTMDLALQLHDNLNRTSRPSSSHGSCAGGRPD